METALGIFAGVALILLMSAAYLKRRGDVALQQLRALNLKHSRAQQEAQAASARWQIVTQNIDEAVILLDDAERVTFLNGVAERLLGSSVKVGQTFGNLTWQSQIQPLIRQVLDRRTELLAQTAVKDERAFQVSVRAGLPNTTCAVLIILSEITELQRLGRVRRDFVANISHELRTPVTTLRLLADTLAQENVGTTAQDWIAKLQRQIDVLHQLTDELMDLALIESGQLPIKLVEVSVSELITDVVALFHIQAERKKITLETNSASEMRVLADPAGARRVLSNLLHNALKFTPENGRVVVAAQQQDDNIEFQVADNGIGIPATDLPRVFERFYRVDPARMSGEARSTGLGLAIAKHIVEGHGGRIGVTSIEGKGSIFYFTLPAVG